MRQPDRYPVRALIPLEDEPGVHIVTAAGELPSLIHRADSGRTYEGTLGELGRKVVGRIVSVDRRRVDLQEDADSGIVYQTKPVSADTVLSPGHTWSGSNR